MPKPTGRNKTASPYARKQESRDVSTMGARPTELRPNKRESYQVATQVPTESSANRRNQTVKRDYPRPNSYTNGRANYLASSARSYINPSVATPNKYENFPRPNSRPNYRGSDESWQGLYNGMRSSSRKKRDLNSEYRMDMLRDVARKKRGY